MGSEILKSITGPESRSPHLVVRIVKSSVCRGEVAGEPSPGGGYAPISSVVLHRATLLLSIGRQTHLFGVPTLKFVHRSAAETTVRRRDCSTRNFATSLTSRTRSGMRSVRSHSK